MHYHVEENAWRPREASINTSHTKNDVQSIEIEVDVCVHCNFLNMNNIVTVCDAHFTRWW